MDKLLPIIILLGITTIGYLSKYFELKQINERISFTNKYRNDFNSYINKLFSAHEFDYPAYCELTKNVNKMQLELGADGIIDYIQDNYRGIVTKNYQVLINFLPKTQDIPSYEGELFIERYIEQSRLCDSMFLRHIGFLEEEKKNTVNCFKNPFICFSAGVKTILSLPLIMLKLFGFISSDIIKRIDNNPITKFFNIIITAVGFLGGIISITLGWNSFWKTITTLFSNLVK